AGPKAEVTDIPQRLRAAKSRKLLRHARGEAQQRGAGIPAQCHGSRAGMVRLPVGADAKTANADNAGDDANAAARRLEPWSLLDVCFQITEMASGIEARGIARGGNGRKRVAQAMLAALGRVDLGRRQLPAECAAAEKREVA